MDNSEALLQVLLTVLTWLIGFGSAVIVYKIKQCSDRKMLIGLLKKELETYDISDVGKIRNRAQERVDATGEGIFVTPHREDYIDWILSRAILNPKKDHGLIKALINLKATITNFNHAVLAWNMRALSDFSVVVGFGNLADEHVKTLQKELSNK